MNLTPDQLSQAMQLTIPLIQSIHSFTVSPPEQKGVEFFKLLQSLNTIKASVQPNGN
jgi:hypothetical protein